MTDFETHVATIRGDFIGARTNSAGEKSITLAVSNQDRMEAELLADLAGIQLELRVYRQKPAEWEADPRFNVIDLPTPEVPS